VQLNQLFLLGTKKAKTFVGKSFLAEGAIYESETCLSQLEKLTIFCLEETQLEDACGVSCFKNTLNYTCIVNLLLFTGIFWSGSFEYAAETQQPQKN